MIHELSVFHVFIPKQVIKTKPERHKVEHRLGFLQTIKHNIRTRKPESTLVLTQSVSYRKATANLSVAHTLNLYQVVGRNPIYETVTQTLFHWQSVQRPKVASVLSNLALTQTVVGHGCKAVKSSLSLGQTVIGNVVRNRTISNSLGLISGVAAWLSDPNFNFLNPVFSIVEKVRFKYNGYQFYVRKPDFDDTYRYDFTRISRRSRGGDLLIARDPIWPAVKAFTIRFSYLSQADIDQFLYFFRLTLGKRCYYLNYDSVEWQGFITNPQSEAVKVGRNNYSLDIEFDGEPL